MLRLTKRADYGMMAMRYLAERADEQKTHSARDIADAYKIFLPVLAKTLQTRARAELVASHHGVLGSYMLDRPAKNISAFDVISAFDGPLLITSCVTTHGSCEMVGHCMVHEPLRRLNESIRTLLSNITVADLKEPTESARKDTQDRLVPILH